MRESRLDVEINTDHQRQTTRRIQQVAQRDSWSDFDVGSIGRASRTCIWSGTGTSVRLENCVSQIPSKQVKPLIWQILGGYQTLQQPSRSRQERHSAHSRSYPRRRQTGDSSSKGSQYFLSSYRSRSKVSLPALTTGSRADEKNERIPYPA